MEKFEINLFSMLSKFERTKIPKKIQCRNSYERKRAHEEAEKRGIEHRTILDFEGEVHQNFRWEYSGSCICDCCSSVLVTCTYTPMSWVEFGNGKEKLVIGEEKHFHKTPRYSFAKTGRDNTLFSTIKAMKGY